MRWLVGQVAQVFVIGVVGEVGDPLGADPVEDEVGEGGLAGAGAAGDPDDEGNGAMVHGLYYTGLGDLKPPN